MHVFVVTNHIVLEVQLLLLRYASWGDEKEEINFDVIVKLKVENYVVDFVKLRYFLYKQQQVN